MIIRAKSDLTYLRSPSSSAAKLLISSGKHPHLYSFHHFYSICFLGDSMLTPTCSCLQHLVGLTCFCLRTKNRARKTYVFANAGSEVMLGWGGVGMLTFFLVRTLDIATLQRISGILATLHVATLQRSLVSLLRYMLLRCRDLWYPCYVTCCYAAEISGILATLHVATLRICEGCPARPLHHKMPYRHDWCCVDQLQTIHPQLFGCQAQRCHVICQNVAMEIHQQVQEAAWEDCRDAAKDRVKKMPNWSDRNRQENHVLL